MTLTCCVVSCVNAANGGGKAVRLHELPKDHETASKWIDVYPELATASKKRPAVCHLHFSPQSYTGKKKYFLRPEAVPSSSLMTFESEIPLELQFAGKCPFKNNEHANLEITLKRLEASNQRLKTEHRSLSRKLLLASACSDNKLNQKDQLIKLLSTCQHLGPTQVRCLANGSTKGRGWTLEEKDKAMKLKSMCNKQCYDYVRKSLVPLPSTWELYASDLGAAGHVVEQVVDHDDADVVHHIIVSPELWAAEDPQQFEFLVAN
jgi:hypothetical protein